MEYTVEYTDPWTGITHTILANLYDYGVWEEDEDNWFTIVSDPEFNKYRYIDPDTGEELDMPLGWKEDVDQILNNVFWNQVQDGEW